MNDFLQRTRLAFRRNHGLAETGGLMDPEDAPDEAVFRLACRHRVAGLWAAELVPAWKRHAAGQALHTARCAAVAEQLAAALEGTLPNLAVIKGPVLAVQAWPQPALRHYDDLDLRCDHVDYARLHASFAAQGYRAEHADRRRNGHLWHYGWGVAFIGPDGLRIECNHRMFPPHFPWPARTDAGSPGNPWETVLLDACAVRAPAPSPHLLLACLHAVWHGWERVSWVVDIAGLLVRCPEALPGARMLAKTGFPRRALDHACRVANGLFGPLPGFPAGASDQNEDLRAAVSLLMRKDTSDGFCVARRLHHGLLNHRERVGYTLRRILIPGDLDFQRWPLPAAWRHAYWVLRPVRLLGVQQ